MNRAADGSAPLGRASLQQSRSHVDNPSAALQGATAAFNSFASRKPVGTPPKNTDNATKAAVLAGRPVRPPPASSQTPSSETSLEPEARSVREKIGMFTDSPVSISTRDIHDDNNKFATSSPRSQTPQHIAAQVAAERSQPGIPFDRSSTRTNSPEKIDRAPSKASQRTDESLNMSHGAYGDNNGSNELLAPKPLRKLSSQHTAIGAALSADKDAWDKFDSQLGVAPKSPGTPSLAGSANPPRLPPRTDISAAPEPSKRLSIGRKPVASQLSLNSQDSASYGQKEYQSVPRASTFPSTSTSDERKPPLPPRRSTAAVNGSSPGGTVDLQDTSRPISRNHTRDVASPALSQPPPPPPSRTPASLRPQTNSVVGHINNNGASVFEEPAGMDENSLSDAIVASSLASSYAPTPVEIAPPLPQRRPRSRSSLLLHRTGDNQRSPSPPKGMRQTLRDHSKVEGQDEHHHHKHMIRIIKKHPHKHHEGDRKRWRNEITEKERKRYEGVWAANKGLWVPDKSLLPPSMRTQNSHTSPQDPSDMVVNVVVKDIWSRSRLPPNFLEKVWDLVDRQGIGMLTRDEFVVGMWLIDQQLKGRKLPVKVSDSVWESVKHVSGIKLLD
ncbi:hypothetical protein DTO021D3_6174 [Paecilomyces variotii]|nr:hypothetical protein DTO032I3_5727 [Paecilomyces variotii]KAJ9276896.1 hypothetical protein DTO021D3_6174 [Paecilomyces variotii]KAJ9341745.1 hypothetical protein DTO027B6_5640 [Paecilomyces variotii]KAJ9379724.1 hypothetical protein DTO032I4_7004 [Paecilomyces variotii]KAJ9403966.1 hypothetical protein DTO045G8_8311 [Paecilomyces variotii]